MNWNKLNELSTESILHMNISNDDKAKSTELLSDALEDDPSKPPEDINNPPGDEDSGNLDAIEGESGGDDSGEGDSGSEGGEGGEGEGSDTSDSSSSDDSSDADNDSTSEIRNNPLDKFNGRIYLIDSYSELENKLIKYIEKFSNIDDIPSGAIKELNDLLDIVKKDKESVSISPLNESILQYNITSKLVIIAIKKILSILESKSESKDNEK